MALTPTPVALSELQDITSDINSMNAGEAQEVRPRTRAFDLVTVEVSDDPWATPAFWTQKQLTGEWQRSGSKSGYATLADYAGGVVDWTIVPE